ncbi:MAG: ribonuclease H-like domain-containing protein, partial [Anaerolineales bacterium]
GKSFDLPLLNGRYLTNGAQPPFRNLPHLDLLHIARRLWREMLPSRALGDLEVQLLGVIRSQEDLPGWLIPQMYIDYLHSGDARPLAGVFYHNSMDVISMAALLDHIATKLAAPLQAGAMHHSELHAIGRLLADIGFAEEAIEVFQSTLALELPEETQFRLVENLACLFRRRGNYEAALQLWERAAADGYVYAHVEIAKYYEHRAGDLSLALHYTQSAMSVVSGAKTPTYERVHWQPLLEYRMERLERKLTRRARQI